MDLLVAAGLGLALGIVTGMPLGVVNVAIVEAALAGKRRFATGIGVGGALADTLHAGVAFVGMGRLVTARPDLVRGLAIAAAILIVGYAIIAWRQRPAATPSDASSATRGAVTGFLLTLPNPGALAAWVAVAAAVWPTASLAEAITVGVGVGVGSAAWFAVLARWIGTLPRDHAAVRLLPRIALVALVGIAAYGVIRVL
ncbi:MAG: LysE family transporter [Myxococcota bacterium]|nr:LysE family transporter [Myxococcota bacterium]